MDFFKLAGCLLLLFSGCVTPDSTKQAGSPIRIRWTRDPETLDPLTLPNQHAVDAANLLHSALLQVDYQTSAYAPALAEQLPTLKLVGDSLLRLDYTLRAEATWDSGQPVLAADVACTLKLLRCPGLPNEMARMQIGFVEDCLLDPANPRHLTLICRGQAPEYSWASGDFPVLSEAAVDPAHTLRAIPLPQLAQVAATSPVVAALVARYRQASIGHHPERLPGCGPYRLVNWQSSRSLLFERKAHWWADRLPAPPVVLQAQARQIQFVIIPDPAAAALALRRHELDVLPNVTARTFQQLQASDKTARQFAFYATSSYDIVLVGFNTQRPALRDAGTRRALRALLNPVALQQATQLGQGRRTASLLVPTSPAYNDTLPLPTYDPGRAAALLRRAGWQRRADGHWYRATEPAPLGLLLRYRTNDNVFAAIGLQFRQAAAQLGIAVELRPLEGTLLTETLHDGQFDVYIGTTKGNPFVLNLAPLLHTQAIGELNFTRFSNPAADQLFEAVAREGQPARKRHLLYQLQALLYQQAPVVPLFTMPYRLVADRRLQHLGVSGLKPGYTAQAMTWGTPETPVAAH